MTKKSRRNDQPNPGFLPKGKGITRENIGVMNPRDQANKPKTKGRIRTPREDPPPMHSSRYDMTRCVTCGGPRGKSSYPICGGCSS